MASSGIGECQRVGKKTRSGWVRTRRRHLSRRTVQEWAHEPTGSFTGSSVKSLIKIPGRQLCPCLRWSPKRPSGNQARHRRASCVSLLRKFRRLAAVIVWAGASVARLVGFATKKCVRVKNALTPFLLPPSDDEPQGRRFAEGHAMTDTAMVFRNRPLQQPPHGRQTSSDSSRPAGWGNGTGGSASSRGGLPPWL